MTDQTIPAEKVRELIKHFESPVVAVDNREAIRFLRALLPAPPQPTSGLLGRWAKHPEYGDVVCIWDRSDSANRMFVRWIDEKAVVAVEGVCVPLDSLMFPHQATKPEDVPAGEAWLVDVEDSEESHKSIVALKDEHDAWRVCGELMTDFFWRDKEVTLISPLTPERPESNLQARYDALDAKYREAQERIEVLEQAAPRIVATEAEYAALPIGSIVSKPDAPHIRHAVFKKIKKNKWERTGDNVHMTDRHMAQMELPVLRYGRGDEEVEP